MKLYEIETIAKFKKTYLVESELDVKELVDNSQLANGFVGFDIVTGNDFGVPNTSIEVIREIAYDEEINNIIAKNKEKAKLKYFNAKLREEFSVDDLSEKDFVNMLIGLNTKFKGAGLGFEFENQKYSYISPIDSDYLNDHTLIHLDYTVDSRTTAGGQRIYRKIGFKRLSERELEVRRTEILFNSIKIGNYTLYYPTKGVDISLQKLFQVLFILGKESLEQEVKDNKGDKNGERH